MSFIDDWLCHRLDLAKKLAHLDQFAPLMDTLLLDVFQSFFPIVTVVKVLDRKWHLLVNFLLLSQIFLKNAILNLLLAPGHVRHHDLALSQRSAEVDLMLVFEFS